MIAAQLVAKGLTKDLPDWQIQLQKGEFTPIRLWLAENTHGRGALYDGLDMVKEITGEELKVKYFRSYLEKKYSDLYAL